MKAVRSLLYIVQGERHKIFKVGVHHFFINVSYKYKVTHGKGLSQDCKNVCQKQHSHNICLSRYSYSAQDNIVFLGLSQ